MVVFNNQNISQHLIKGIKQQQNMRFLFFILPLTLCIHLQAIQNDTLTETTVQNTTSPNDPLSTPAITVKQTQINISSIPTPESNSKNSTTDIIRANAKSFSWYGNNDDCIFKCQESKGEICGNRFFDCCTPGFCQSISNHRICLKPLPNFNCIQEKKAKSIFPQLSNRLIYD